LSSAGTFSVLHNFSEPDGGAPNSGLILDSHGNLYGTTRSGGAHDQGTVFKSDLEGNLTTLYSFRGGRDGVGPTAALLLRRGRIYGTTYQGGGHNAGTVFRVNATTGQEKILYRFTGGADGAAPDCALVTDGADIFYGTTSKGGDTDGDGVVFAVSESTGQETVVHTFTGKDGKRPYGGLVRDSATGTIYGMASEGGSDSDGIIFSVDSSNTFTVLHTFSGLLGREPVGGLTRGPTGALYGITELGGDPTCRCGLVFKIVP
jgi:uncharacterized repeat protein (TIGR03803 family)